MLIQEVKSVGDSGPQAQCGKKILKHISLSKHPVNYVQEQ